MHNGKYVMELSIDEVIIYYKELQADRVLRALNDEEKNDFAICQERLISYAITHRNQDRGYI